MTHPLFEQTGPASGRIRHGNEDVAEIRDMCLCNLRLRRGGGIIVGKDVPVPLYWRQYAHHESPERNAGSEAQVERISSDGDRLVLRCKGTNSSREIRSVYTLSFNVDADNPLYVFDIHAQLEVLPLKRWHITHNAYHGELEFCNFWPEGTFSATPGSRKAYSACFVERGPATTLIPHHHLESSDKHNIRMRKDDRFGWLLEDENPVIQLLSDDEVSAGLCAYMWDAHIAYRCCMDARDMLLPGGTRREALIRLTSLSRQHASLLLERGSTEDPSELDRTPIYVRGLNTFRETIRAFPEPPDRIWPWTFEILRGNEAGTLGTLDREIGFDDNASLRVSTLQAGKGHWVASTLGPAFNDPPFSDGKRYRLTSMVRTKLITGAARVGVRLHRDGFPDLGNSESYEHFWSERSCSGESPWTALKVITPPISPPPDRVHLLLQHDGEGLSWFDNISFGEDEE